MGRMVQLAGTAAIVLSFAMIALAPDAQAQTQIGGVDVPGEWYVGEGLEIGDYFSYEMCHVNYKECKEFRLNFWIEGEKTVGNENKWLAYAVVYDGNKIIKGTIELGKVAPEPTGGSPELLTYRSAFKSSIVWLSAFATSYGGSGGDGPKEFSSPSWGKIANIGGEQILPTEVRRINTRAGTFEEAISITWRTGGASSAVWIVDEFPFPIRASTYVHVSEGIPPQEYRFELLEYGNAQTDPYASVVATDTVTSSSECGTYTKLVKTKRGTQNGDYLVNLQHGPQTPIAGCDMTMLISFNSKYDETEFLNQVQYDIIVTNESDEILYSLANAEGVRTLFSASGQTRNNEMWVPSEPGKYVYAIVISGLAPLNTVPTSATDILRVPITVIDNMGTTTPPPVLVDPTSDTIPTWIKTSAQFWVDGSTSDAEFVSAIGFLVSEGVIVVGDIDEPPRNADTSVPSWIKSTTQFWIDGNISEIEFVSAIEFLIGEGVIVVR